MHAHTLIALTHIWPGSSPAPHPHDSARAHRYGALVHNIASCLHCMGDFDTAKVHYEQALLAFQKDPPSKVGLWLYGDPGKKRSDFVRERLVDIEMGRKPDVDK